MNSTISSTIPIMRPWLGAAEADAAAEAVASGWVAQGPRVAAFEEAFASHVGATYGVAVSSCTTALHLALVLAGIGTGDEVIVPSLSFIATANVVRYVGATPVFADVDPTTQNLTAATLSETLTAATRAVIVVHQAGVPADLEPLRTLCGAFGIALIEDAACAAGSTYHGELVGTDSRLAAFSFHPRKILTTGEGGMLLTNDAEIAVRARRLREHGMSMSAIERHAHSRPVVESYLETGFNYRMTDIQAAVGLVQLDKLDTMIARRRLLAERYRDALGIIDDLQMAADPAYGTTNFQSFWVMLPDDLAVERNDVMARMSLAGVSTRRGIMAAHLEPAYGGHPHGPLPVTERLTRRSLILPLFHEMTEADQDRVITAFFEATGLRARKTAIGA